MTRIMKRSVAVATAVAVSAVSLPAIATAQESNAVTGGEFTWGIKESFLGYVTSDMAGGKVETTEGATFANNLITFPVDEEDSEIDASGNGTIALDGTATILAHEGLGPEGGGGLDAEFSDLKLEVTGTSAELIGDYEVGGSAGENGEAVARTGDDAVLATISLPSAIAAGTYYQANGASVTTGAGIEDALLRYEVGSELDPADLSVEFAEGTGSENPGEENPGEENPVEGSSDVGLIAAVVAVIAAIGGAVAVFGGFIPGLSLPF